MANNIENVYKVKLTNNWKTVGYQTTSKKSDVIERVIFDVTPDLIENRNVNYRSLDPVHMPGNFQIYQNTSSRTFQISNIKVISRTSEEATYNYDKLKLLRSWTMPYFGSGTKVNEETDYQGANVKTGTNSSTTERNSPGTTLNRAQLGAPPPVLIFSAYAKGKKGHFKNIPVVITNLQIPLSSDVDYIPTSEQIPMPTVMNIDVQLTEVHSPREFATFSLNDFKNGILDGF